MVGDDEAKVRAERVRAIGLFRYQLVREAADSAVLHPGAGTDGARALAGAEHADPVRRRVRISRQTIDRWIWDWRGGGFAALVPNPRQAVPRTPAEVLDATPLVARYLSRRAQPRHGNVHSSTAAPKPFAGQHISE